MRLGKLALLAASVLPTGGCCSVARFFCGPDRTPWVSEDYSSPERAVQTLLEALRRDDPEVVYRSVSRAYREQLGLDSGTLLVAWPEVRAKNPGMHLAGYAAIPAPLVLGPDRMRFELDVEGYRVDVDVVRQRQWTVRYRCADGTELTPGDSLAAARPHVTVDEDADTGVLAVRVAPMVLPTRFDRDGNAEPVRAEQITFAGYYVEWKVDALVARDQP